MRVLCCMGLQDAQHSGEKLKVKIRDGRLPSYNSANNKQTMNNMKFILPRVFGLAIIAGIASLLLAMIAKVLLAASFIGMIAYFIRKGIQRRRRDYMQAPYGMQSYQGYAQMQAGPEAYYGQSPFYRNDVMPVGNAQRPAGIIPIN